MFYTYCQHTLQALKYPSVMLLAFCLFCAADNDFVKTEVAEGITMSLPKSFAAMTEAQVSQRYLSTRAPVAAYTSPDQQTDLSVSTSNARWEADDLPMLQNFYRSNITSLYDEVEFLTEKIERINGKDFVVFEMVSVVKPDSESLNAQTALRKYTYILYTVHKGKTFVFNFNCPAGRQAQWQETAGTIMHSIRIK